MPPPNQKSVNKIVFASVAKAKGHRIMIYGPGGVGKTTLAVQAPGPVAVMDADESLPILKSQLADLNVDLPSIVPATDFASLLAALRSTGWEGVKTIVLDTATRIEEWAVAHTLLNTPHEKGHKIKSIEGYGFGKGYQHVFETFQLLLGELDRHVREGRNVILIAHDVTASVPNPNGEDWIRYEPRLQSPKSGGGSIRHKLKEWCDHVLFIGYDVNVDGNKKAKGSGTRSMYSAELPFCMAKSRTTNETFNIEIGGELPWSKIIR